MSRLSLVPTMVVVISGPEVRMAPFRLHVIEMGMSPLEMTQDSCA